MTPSLRLHRRFACLLPVIAACALAVAAPSASAQTSQGGYTPPSSNTQAEIQSDAPSHNSRPASTTVHRTTSSDGNGVLPFTGLDLGFIGLVGVGLVAVGLGLRRLTLRGGPVAHRNTA
jgi:hypothetical protein